MLILYQILQFHSRHLNDKNKIFFEPYRHIPTAFGKWTALFIADIRFCFMKKKMRLS